MSQFYGTARTNLFRVKDEEAFKAWAEKFGLRINQWDSHPGLIGLLPDEMSDDGLFYLSPDLADEGEDGDDDNYGDEEIELATELAKHVAPGSVAVIMSAAAEKATPAGWAEAVDHTGKRIAVSLYDIFEKAKTEFGVEPVRW